MPVVKVSSLVGRGRVTVHHLQEGPGVTLHLEGGGRQLGVILTSVEARQVCKLLRNGPVTRLRRWLNLLPYELEAEAARKRLSEPVVGKASKHELIR